MTTRSHRSSEAAKRHEHPGPSGEVVANFDDVTGRRRAEERWQESERRFMALFQSSPIPTMLARLEDGLVQDANRAFLELVGYGRTEVVGHSVRELGLWAEPEECQALVRRLRAGELVHGAEAGFRKRTGEVGTVLISAAIVEWGGQPHLLATALDHTERKRVEAAFHASEAVRRQALESSPDAVFAIDREYRLLFNNQRHQRLLVANGGRPLAAGENVLLPGYPPEVRAHWRDAYDRALRGEGVRFEVEWSSLDGTTQVFENSLSPLRDAAGAIIGALVVARDVTERKRLEAEKAGALARLAVVEEQERHRLSRELHDQMAQRLVALAVDLKLLETNLAAGRPEAGRVRSMRRAVDDLQKRVRQMAWDLRAGEGLEGELATTIREYVEDWSERVNVPVDFEIRGLDGKRLPALLETTLYRVTQEALVNVEKHARARRVGVLLQLEKEMVRLTVEDDGSGFDVDAVWASLEKTHRLGLLGMRERVALAGGTFLVESSPGGGTTILVRIPLAAGTEIS